MPLLYDDPYRDVERDPLRAAYEIVERHKRGGTIWAIVATTHPRSHETPSRPVADPYLISIAEDFTLERAPWPVPPPAITPWLARVEQPHDGAVAGYVDFVNRWRSFAALYLLTDRTTASYYCQADERDVALHHLCLLNRWPSEPASSPKLAA